MMPGHGMACPLDRSEPDTLLLDASRCRRPRDRVGRRFRPRRLPAAAGIVFDPLPDLIVIDRLASPAGFASEKTPGWWEPGRVFRASMRKERLMTAPAMRRSRGG